MAETPSIQEFLLDGEDEYHLAYYSAIGRIVVAWSMLEIQFDANLLSLFADHNGRSLVEKPPVSMSRKIDFWRDCFRNLPDLATLKSEAFEFARMLEAVSGRRNILLHTNWGNILGKQRGEVRGVSLRSIGNGYRVQNATLSLESLTALLHEIAGLQNRCMRFTFALMSPAFPPITDKS